MTARELAQTLLALPEDHQNRPIMIKDAHPTTNGLVGREVTQVDLPEVLDVFRPCGTRFDGPALQLLAKGQLNP